MRTPQTPYLRRLHHDISILDNHLWFDAFVAEQFLQDSSDRVSQLSSESYITDAFLENQHAKRVHIRKGAFAKRREEYERWVLQSWLIHLCAVIDSYEGRLFSMCHQVSGEIVSKDDNFGLITAWLSMLSGTPPDRVYWQYDFTGRYIRWRRNQIVHAEGDSAGKFKQVAKAKAAIMTKFWTDRLGTSKYSVNFRVGDLL